MVMCFVTVKVYLGVYQPSREQEHWRNIKQYQHHGKADKSFQRQTKKKTRLFSAICLQFVNEIVNEKQHLVCREFNTNYVL